MAERSYLSSRLLTISQLFTARGESCFEPCFRFLLYGDPTATRPEQTSTSSMMHRTFSSVFQKHSSYEDENETLKINSSQGSLSPALKTSVPSAIPLNQQQASPVFSGKSMNTSPENTGISFDNVRSEDIKRSLSMPKVGSGSNEHSSFPRDDIGLGREFSNVPYPRLCGASFSMNGTMDIFASTS
jgi:hypothetical protein